jgi:pimeloyl-ACP methyl ester carboxylesterase
MNVVVDGLMTNFLKAGKGKTIIMLHGWGDDSRTFLPLIEKLKQSYEIYALDLPGFGGTQAPPEAWGLNDYADFLEAWLAKLGLQPFVLIGHSNGGAVAVVTAGKRKVSDKLILLASSGVRNKRPLRKKIIKAGAKAGKIPLLVLPAKKRQSVKAKLYEAAGSEAMLIPHMQETFRKIVATDIRPMANQVSVPTLLVYGSSDKQTPTSDGHMLTRSIKGSRMEIIKAGHFLHQEEPDKVARLIKEFLSS